MARMPYIYHSWWGYTRDEANSPRVFGKPVKVSVISWAWSRFNRNSPVFHCSESLQQFPLSLGMTQVQQKTATFVFRKPATVSAISWDGTGATARNVFCSYLKLKAYNGVCYLSGMEQVHRKKLLHSTQGSAISCGWNKFNGSYRTSLLQNLSKIPLTLAHETGLIL